MTPQHGPAFLLLGAGLGALLLHRLLPLLRQRLVDQPNARSSHRRPTPRGGGVAFVLVAIAASLLALVSGSRSATAALPLLALPLALVGFLDDRHNLPASWRYGVQLATALLKLRRIKSSNLWRCWCSRCHRCLLCKAGQGFGAE